MTIHEAGIQLARLDFEIAVREGGARTVTPRVDGRSLVELVAAFERERGFWTTGAAYGGLIPAYFRYGPLDRYFMADPDCWTPTWLLGCSCGEVGCWPLECRVVVTDATVTWEEVHQPHRPEWGSYEGFGPFVFERAQYEAAVRELAAEFGGEAE